MASTSGQISVEHFDVLVLGSGFGGSLLSMILARQGRTVAMIDRAVHPRFAIGESSTPLADATLSRLAQTYDLPNLLPLTHYGSWKRTYPNVLCGRKRGFTYFDQIGNEDLTIETFNSRRLLASASQSNDVSDTHWLRSDVDAFLCEQAEHLGVQCLQGCQYRLTRDHEAEPSVTGQAKGWVANGVSSISGPFQVSAAFVVDATGSAGGLLRQLNIPWQTDSLKTNSRSIFSHFADAMTCEQLLLESGIDVSGFPYACDDAAVHQVIHDGWMWQLRFDDNSLSAGFVIDQRHSHQREATLASADDEWNRRVSQKPFLARQFRNARSIRLTGGIQQTSRLQRLTTQAAGTDWAVLTNTAGFIDALHSTGIAHTLFAVERLARILGTEFHAPHRHQALKNYSEQLIDEIRLVDIFVEGCYAALPWFDLWCAWTMLYFSAVTSMEQKAFSAADCQSSIVDDPGFLRARDPSFRAMLTMARQKLAVVTAADQTANAREEFITWLRHAIQPWNSVGLLNPSANGLYHSTAARS